MLICQEEKYLVLCYNTGKMSSQTFAYFKSVVQHSKELNRREKEIVLRRLEKKPLHRIGRKYKLTGERIRQIEKGALCKFIKKTCQLILID